MNKIHNMDCIEGMKQMDFKADLLLTDPPYGIGESNEKNLSRGTLAKPKDYGHYEWDKEIPSTEYFKLIMEKSYNQVIFGGNYFLDHLGATSCFIVWDKDNGDNDFADCELAWTSFKSAVRRFKWRWNGMLQEKSIKEPRYHPTQKPLALAIWIIENYSKPGDIIMDTHAGSGTFCLAAKLKGRQFIGFEKEEKYVKIANERLKQDNMNKWIS